MFKRLFLSLALTLGIFTIPIQSFATVQSTIDKKIYQGQLTGIGLPNTLRTCCFSVRVRGCLPKLQQVEIPQGSVTANPLLRPEPLV